MSRKKKVSVSLEPWQVRKIDAVSRRFWPSLRPSKCRASVLRVLLNYADARTSIPRLRRYAGLKRPGGKRKQKVGIMWATWSKGVGYWAAFPTRSDARLSFSPPQSGYRDWKSAQRDGWKIFKCWLTPAGC